MWNQQTAKRGTERERRDKEDLDGVEPDDEKRGGRRPAERDDRGGRRDRPPSKGVVSRVFLGLFATY